MKYILQTIALLIITACSPSLDEQVNKLVEGKNKWIKSVTNRNYTYTIKYMPNSKEIKVKVLNGSVVSASHKNGESFNIKYLKTMKQHFEFILDMLKKEEREGTVALEVEYHETLGYPSSIKINIKRSMHGRSTILISKVAIQ